MLEDILRVLAASLVRGYAYRSPDYIEAVVVRVHRDHLELAKLVLEYHRPTEVLVIYERLSQIEEFYTTRFTVIDSPLSKKAA